VSDPEYDLDSLLKQSDSTDLNVLLTAKENAKRAVLDNPSDRHLAALDRASKMLKAFVDRQNGEEPETAAKPQESAPVEYSPSKKKIDVFHYLIKSGWNVSQSTFYKHVKEGKLVPDKDDGLFKKRPVDKYGRTHLPRVETGKKVDEEADDLARRKQRAEIDKLEHFIKREKFKHDVEQGKYILRERIQIEQAGKAAVLYAGLKSKARSRAPEIIAAVKGDQTRTGELITMLIDMIDEGLHKYSSVKEFQVVFPAGAKGDEQ